MRVVRVFPSNHVLPNAIILSHPVSNVPGLYVPPSVSGRLLTAYYTFSLNQHHHNIWYAVSFHHNKWGKERGDKITSGNAVNY